MSITKKRKMYMTGGIPIYPGGFSCVFKPQLKCKSKNKMKRNKTRRNKYSGNYDKTGISKLLFKEHAKLEMDNIQLFYNALKSIPKSHKYFLFTKSKLCSPAKISKRDLKGFDNMCTSFTNREINESNINSNIDDLRLINMPNAGVTVNEWLLNTRLTSARIILFNKLMTELIVNAIVPMNKMGVINNDVKEDNILISLSKTNPRPTIIDCGISGISTPQHPIPEIIMNRYISVSNPFSSIIFTSDFIMSYSVFLQTHNNPSTFKDSVDRLQIAKTRGASSDLLNRVRGGSNPASRQRRAGVGIRPPLAKSQAKASQRKKKGPKPKKAASATRAAGSQAKTRKAVKKA